MDRHDLGMEALRIAPAAGGIFASAALANVILLWLSVFYLVGLIGYHFRRWWIMERKFKQWKVDALEDPSTPPPDLRRTTPGTLGD